MKKKSSGKKKNKKIAKIKAILTRKEAAALLSISLTTLKKWSDLDYISSYQLGGRVYYKQRELLKALKKIQIVNREKNEIKETAKRSSIQEMRWAYVKASKDDDPTMV